MVHVAILAGGGGERLWPKSRKNLPKQCIALNGKKSLIQVSYERALKITGQKNILVSTFKDLESIIRNQLPDANIIAEPLGRDSAAGMAYVCGYLNYKGIDEPTVFMGADYFIPDTSFFLEVIKSAIELALKGKITLIGIKPTRIETRFGYIELGEEILGTHVAAYKVKKFTEKPDEPLAKQYIKRGYLWNSGMFIAKPSVILTNIKKYMPILFKSITKIIDSKYDQQVAFNEFGPLPKISIDYGVMEKTSDLAVVKGEFLWDDIGTWSSLDRILPRDPDGNIVQGEFLGLETQNSIIFGEKPVVTFGVSDMVIVNMNDCVFVCSKDRAEEIKALITELGDHRTLKKLLLF
ncbi:MAG: mannose-1-phosphate guanylyltransferase [Candidatus Heimdallarchaeota archaeon]|nr:mannose-1-phosphate guanylyltransferase [Candidatus Heimdallarchaeota archaeon]